MRKIKDMLTAAVGRVSKARRRRLTMRILDALPDYIRKDIGWPPARRFGGSPFAD